MGQVELGNVVEGASGSALRFAGVPVDGTSGTFAKKAPKGAPLYDTANGVAYVNTGTQASPVWTKVGTQT